MRESEREGERKRQRGVEAKGCASMPRTGKTNAPPAYTREDAASAAAKHAKTAKKKTKENEQRSELVRAATVSCVE